jgi:hypothetical protein
MAHFRFIAVDSRGRTKRGAVEASSEIEAVARIENSGLTIQSIETDGSDPGKGAITLSFERPPPRQRAGGMTSVALSLIALGIASTALGFVLFRDPLGAGIGKYDLSTPKSSLESRLKIQLNNDVRALLELERQIQGKKLKEKLDTLEIRKEAEFRGRKILFVAYKSDGINKYSLEYVEKDANTGYWLPTFVNSYDVEKENKDLAVQMRKWEE